MLEMKIRIRHQDATPDGKNFKEDVESGELVQVQLSQIAMQCVVIHL
jgi:hypothetical protein